MKSKISFVHYFLLIIFIFFILLVLIKNNNYFNDFKIESYQNNDDSGNDDNDDNDNDDNDDNGNDGNSNDDNGNDDNGRKCPDTCIKKKDYGTSGTVSILDSTKEDEDNSETKNPEIKNFTYNNVNYWGVSETGCFNKSDDFDNWCRYNYIPDKFPSGYSENGIGAQKILHGTDGGCNNPNLARAICDFNSIQEVKKIEPLLIESSDNLESSQYNDKYNNFTNCILYNVGDFKKQCSRVLSEQNVIPAEIMGYDCNPGYYRAKCMKLES